MMIDNEVSFTSLCYITVDYEGRIWLNRLADVEDDILHTPFKSERTDNYFENRDRLYRNDGPTALGTVGIWEWTAIPNRDNPAIDYVQSYYVKDYSPVRVVVLMAKSLDEVVEQLQNGTARTQAYFCDTLFCYEPKWGQFAGVLCRANEFNISDRCAKLSETVYSLPSYTISSGDIYNWDDRNLRFLKTLQVGEPSGYVSIGNTDEVIRTLILERTTWPLFKECKEIHLFIPSAGYRLPERQGQNKISPCYLDVQSGFIDFSDDSLDGKQGIRKLYYSGFTAKARPDILTFSTCPHCRHELSKMQLTSFNTRGNQSFFNLIKAQFQAQPAVPGKILSTWPSRSKRACTGWGSGRSRSHLWLRR